MAVLTFLGKVVLWTGKNLLNVACLVLRAAVGILKLSIAVFALVFTVVLSVIKGAATI